MRAEEETGATVTLPLAHHVPDEVEAQFFIQLRTPRLGRALLKHTARQGT